MGQSCEAATMRRDDCFKPSLRASSPIWASEASLARTRERAAKPRGADERPLAPRPLARAFWESLLAGYFKRAAKSDE